MKFDTEDLKLLSTERLEDFKKQMTDLNGIADRHGFEKRNVEELKMIEQELARRTNGERI